MALVCRTRTRCRFSVHCLLIPTLPRVTHMSLVTVASSQKFEWSKHIWQDQNSPATEFSMHEPSLPPIKQIFREAYQRAAMLDYLKMTPQHQLTKFQKSPVRKPSIFELVHNDDTPQPGPITPSCCSDPYYHQNLKGHRTYIYISNAPSM